MQAKRTTSRRPMPPSAPGPLAGETPWAVIDALLDAVHQPMLVVDDGLVVVANEPMRRLLAGPQTVGRRLADFLDQGVLPVAGKTGEDGAQTLFLRMPPGQLPLAARRQEIRPAGLRQALTIVTAEGTDSIEPPHTALRDSESRFRAIVNTLPMPVAITRLEDDCLAFVNEPWCRMAGLEPEDVIGREVTDFYVDPSDRERLKTALEASGSVQQFLTRQRFGSRTLWVELRAVTMSYGGYPATLSVFQDVTDAREQERLLVEAKEAAEDANRVKNEFLASMSHELRTPLNAILGFSDLIQQQSFGPVGDPRYAEYARDINKSGALLLRRIDDVLDLAKMEAGKLALQEEVFDIADAVTLALGEIEPKAASGRVAVGAEPAIKPFWLRADQRRVTQILVNLLSNAVKYTHPGGRVGVTCDVNDKGAGIVVVRDTGIGIVAEDLKRLTEPFVQLESTMTRRFSGSGLGLAIVRSLVEMHGGRIAIESEPGKGTAVTVAFPPERVVAQ